MTKRHPPNHSHTKNRTVLLCGLFFVVLLCLHSEEMKAVISEFEIPISGKEGHATGSIKGTQATFPEPTIIDIDQADIFLEPDGSPRWFRLQTPACQFLKDKNRLQGNAPVTIESKGLLIDGDGLKWDLNKQTLIVKKRVTVDLTKGLPVEGNFP